MARRPLVQELMALQLVAKERGYSEAWAWLGKAVARLLEEDKPKRKKRPRGRWVRLAATGERAFLDARAVEAALREAERR